MNTTKLTFNEIARVKPAASWEAASNGGQNPPPPAGEKMLDIKLVQAMVGLCKSMVYKLIKEGRFPAPRKVGRASRWLMSEVLAWMRACRTA